MYMWLDIFQLLVVIEQQIEKVVKRAKKKKLEPIRIYEKIMWEMEIRWNERKKMWKSQMWCKCDAEKILNFTYSCVYTGG